MLKRSMKRMRSLLLTPPLTDIRVIMRNLLPICAYATIILSLAACAVDKPLRAPSNAVSAVNPLLAKWVGIYEVPPFDQIKVADFKPALEEAIAQQRREIQVIAENPAPATFDNTVVPFENSGQTMRRVMAVYEVWHSAMNGPEFQKIDQEMAPKLAAFQDEITQNSALFKRIEAVFKSPAKSQLTPEQQRLVWFHETRFVLHGAQLADAQKTRVAQINQRLASLSTQFTQNELGDEETDALILSQAADLAGLPQSQIDAAASEGEHRGMKGKWVIANTRSSMEPFLTYAEKRDLREKAFRIWTSRGDNDNAHNNNKIVSEILKLRAERSKLLGYPTFAHWHLADTMAKDPQTAMALMMKVWRPALAQVQKEVADMQAIMNTDANAKSGGAQIQPWDYRFYAEKVRKAKYDFDETSVKPYLQLKNIREAMFSAAKRLYGFTFVQLHDMPVYHDGMSAYKVTGRDGGLVGIWYFDPYARPGKNSGAWMDAYREQQKMGGKETKTIVSNNANFIPAKPGEPVLLSWDDAVTMFHEFGHALHGLNSNVTYPSLSGTNTAGDFVEFPSQFNENYLKTPEVLKLLTDKDGHPLPKELIKKLDRAKTFNSGFDTVEFLASAIVDMKLHLAGDTTIEPRAFERDTLKELGMPSEIVMRHRIPQFGHLFSSEDYAAGYYGYLWAQVLEADAFEAFQEKKGPYDAAVAKRFHDTILSIGNTIDPSDAYQQFRGRPPKVDALLRARGFPVPNAE
jgi:peptidyl-dipeptidase Dcp